MKIKQYIILAFTAIFISQGCTDFLDEEVYTQYDPDSYLQTREGINSVLAATYSESSYRGYAMREGFYTFGEFTGDIMLESGGGFERSAVIYMNFTWDSEHGFLRSSWARLYRAIRNANSLLDNIGSVTAIPTDQVASLEGEAQFLRAFSYWQLFDLFGLVPIVTSTEELNFNIKRPSQEEFYKFMETQLRDAATKLSVEQSLSGKATKGAALALLGRFYLNTKQWQKCADVEKEVIDLNKYELFAEIEEMFTPKNEINKENIFVSECLALGGFGNIYMAHAFPPKYPIQSNWINYGAQFRLRTDFVKSFEATDRRKKMILTEYTRTDGVFVNLLEDATGNHLDNCRSFKYKPDPESAGGEDGNDIPVLRYSDVLLSRAEALNELNGVNQESVDLINEVRRRAQVTEYTLADFTTKDQFRDAILDERGWEFFSEGLRRQDLIRHSKFVSRAVARGVDAKAHHVLFPIPQREMDSNPNLKPQNEGY